MITSLGTGLCAGGSLLCLCRCLLVITSLGTGLCVGGSLICVCRGVS